MTLQGAKESAAMSLEGFFATAAGVAGALIGLLFVAIGMLRARLAEQDDAQETRLHQVKAATTLTALSNALTVSLMVLIPGHYGGWTATTVAATGLLTIV